MLEWRYIIESLSPKLNKITKKSFKTTKSTLSAIKQRKWHNLSCNIWIVVVRETEDPKNCHVMSTLSNPTHPPYHPHSPPSKQCRGHNPHNSLATTASSVWKFYYAQAFCLFPSIHYCWSELNTLQKSINMTFHSATFLLLPKLDNSPKDSPMNPVRKPEPFKKINYILSNVKNMHSNCRKLGKK